MSALVTDQFRILNATNFVESVKDSTNSYYVFVGLSNPSASGYGRYEDWNLFTPNPTDNVDSLNHYKSTMLFGKKITSANIRRVIRKIEWIPGTRYEMYRSDYSAVNPTPVTGSIRPYDANYYVINSDFRVYICIDNGSTGINTVGNTSEIEPTFTDLEPAKFDDGYSWKYLYTVSPSDIIKFDSTEYISLPNDWDTSVSPQIVSVRENGDSVLNDNQIKKVYIQNGGEGYGLASGQTCNLVGDGSDGTVSLEVDQVTGTITDVIVTSGGKNYTYALVDLGTSNSSLPAVFAELIPIIPPSKGHGFDIYTELGADKILIYARFDDSTKDFPVDAKFAQVGILKNPRVFDSTGINTSIYQESTFSGVYGMKLSSIDENSGTLTIGDTITQSLPNNKIAIGYVVSYDSKTNVLKYSRDRSLYYGGGGGINHVDFVGITSYFSSETNTVLDFDPSLPVNSSSGFSGTIDSTFCDSKITVNNEIVNLGMEFRYGLANPEINSKSGEVIYIDNRPTVTRNLRQKEDVKIILEF